MGYPEVLLRGECQRANATAQNANLKEEWRALSNAALAVLAVFRREILDHGDEAIRFKRLRHMDLETGG